MNRVKGFLLACISTGFILLCRNGILEGEFLRNLTTEEEDVAWLLEEATRPVMHTFFSPIWPNRLTRDPMLEEWKYQWNKAGFATKILTIEDAQKHPDFSKMQTAVEKAFPTDVYNQLCFYRYLSMAESGGGWMSDYDTFPTNFPIEEGRHLPNGGNFTSYQAHVPALIAASADEWTRVGKLLVDAIPRVANEVKSDMYALLVLREEETHDIKFMAPSWNVKQKLMYSAPHKIDCRDMAIGRAIHFSHSAMARAFNAVPSLFPIAGAEKPLSSEDRAHAASVFMNEWRHQCGGSNVPTIDFSAQVADSSSEVADSSSEVADSSSEVIYPSPEVEDPSPEIEDLSPEVEDTSSEVEGLAPEFEESSPEDVEISSEVA